MEEIEKDSGRDMTPRLIGETWRKYPTDTSKQKATYGLYECQYCGEEFKCQTSHIKNGSTKSCGCYINIERLREAATTHGMSQSKFYQTWYDMKRRCYAIKRKDYKWYGGKGIAICEEWLDPKVFINWCEETYIEGLTLDRIDVDKNYQPSNCRWVDMSVQNINKGILSTNTSGYTGVTWHKNVKRWCSTLRSQGVLINVGTFKDKIEAILARDNYIIENGLPHPISSLSGKEKINE